MAFTRKPLSELTPAYRKRIEKYESQGLTRAQARGHATLTQLGVKDIRLAKQGGVSSHFVKLAYKSKDPEIVKAYNKARKSGWNVKGKPTKETQDYIKAIRPKREPGQEWFAIGTTPVA